MQYLAGAIQSLFYRFEKDATSLAARADISKPNYCTDMKGALCTWPGSVGSRTHKFTAARCKKKPQGRQW